MMKNYLSPREFRRRFVKVAMLAFGMFTISILIGILGYHYIVKLDWVSAFLNASMILGGMGPVADLTNNDQKIFAGLYALFSGVAFLGSVAIFLSPIIHRFLVRFHMDIDPDEGSYD